jgi:pimeloyl-ACP methyl ester carboxylesterase
MTRQTVRFGRIITERRRTLTVLRNIGFRAAMRIRPVRTYLQEARWFPDTVCRRGLLSHVVPGPAVGSFPSRGFARETVSGHASTTSSPAGGHCCTPVRRRPGRPGPPTARRACGSSRSVRTPPLARDYVGQLYAITGWSSLPWLRTLRQPSLVLAGDDDPIVPLVNGRILARRIPPARLQVIHGHLFILERPAEVAELVAQFLDSGGAA